MIHFPQIKKERTEIDILQHFFTNIGFIGIITPLKIPTSERISLSFHDVPKITALWHYLEFLPGVYPVTNALTIGIYYYTNL